MDPDPLSPVIASQEVISPVRSPDMDSDLQLAMVEDPISENPVTDPPSPINAIQEFILPVSSADTDLISQLVMMDDPISENPVSPLSCPPLNMVAPTTTPPPPTTSSTKTTASLCTSTVTVSPSPTCEYKCGNWCSSPLPPFTDANSCGKAVAACSVQLASCFLKAGFPESLECFKFSSWCSSVSSYCNRSEEHTSELQSRP